MGKLVRDGTPELIQQSGRTPRFSVLGESDFRGALRDKLDEEATELRCADTRDEVLDEAADVLEVLSEIVALHKISLDAVVARAHAKRSQRGGFTRRLWLEGVEPGS
ncbi:MAG: phosphoribosyl-ATP pyrophosphohydrolase [Mycobacterium sp.]|nr:MAG: phosphoribosyl-ATP pyrophosphohydrolase [Mycobacterium sp.]